MNRLTNRRALSALLLTTTLLTGCSALGTHRVDLADVAEHVALAEEEIAAGRLDDAVRRLVAVRATDRLLPEERAKSERLLTESVDALLDRFAADGSGSDAYDSLFELELPTRLRAIAGMRAAEALFEEGHQVLAYQKIRSIDRKLPTHNARGPAGELLARIGLWLIRNDGRYNLVFSYRKRGVTALEYLVVQYPLSSGCPEAYAELAAYYEGIGDLDYSIERHEDLIVFHAEHPLSIESEARLPYLRMERLVRDDYDRGEVLLAASEIERWLQRYQGHELEGWMRELEIECVKRMARSDLILARYYRRIDSPFGARMHAERAATRASQMGLESTAQEALALLASLPASEASLPSVELLPDVEAQSEAPESGGIDP